MQRHLLLISVCFNVLRGMFSVDSASDFNRRLNKFNILQGREREATTYDD